MPGAVFLVMAGIILLAMAFMGYVLSSGWKFMLVHEIFISCTYAGLKEEQT